MKEVFILQNMSACHDFINNHLQDSYNDESLLGVGSFSSSHLLEENKGASIKVTPQFLEQDLIDYIIQGYISVFEQESIYIQTQLKNSSNIISKWLISGIHSAIFSLPDRDVLKYLKLLNINSVDGFINNYFNSIISKINEMKAEIVVVLLDIPMLKDFLIKLNVWFNSDKNSKLFLYKENLNGFLIKELLYFLSSTFFNNKIAIVPSSPNYFSIFLSTIREIKKEPSENSKDIIFKF